MTSTQDKANPPPFVKSSRFSAVFRFILLHSISTAISVYPAVSLALTGRSSNHNGAGVVITGRWGTRI